MATIATTNTAVPPSHRFDIAFCAVPMLGHLMPLIPYAEELKRRGHHITIFHDSAPKYRQEYGLGDCELVPYQCPNDDTWSKAIYERITAHYTAFPKPDVIVYDFFATDAADAADKMKVPAVGVFPNPRSINPWVATLEEQHSFKWKLWCYFVIWTLEGTLARILWTMRSYQRFKRGLPVLNEQDIFPSPFMPRPMLGCTCSELEFPDLPPAPLFRMVGPSLPEQTTKTIDADLQRWINAQGKNSIVYVAFGTQYRHTEASLQTLEATLRNLGSSASIFWSLPSHQKEWLQHAIPSHWHIATFLPQVALL